MKTLLSLRETMGSAAVVIVLAACLARPARAGVVEPDLIVYNGKIVTVDAGFSICHAMAVKDGKIVAVGGDRDVLASKGAGTQAIDLAGKMVLPGLIDSHLHPSAALTEFDHPVPQMECIADVLAYVKSRAQAVGPGNWVNISQVFITRLKEQRYPTRQELDAAAPNNPVLFATGPDASLNSVALELSGIDAHFEVGDGGSGFAEKDPATGQPTGILRNCTRYVKSKSTGRTPSQEEACRRTIELFRDYNANGLTAIGDRMSNRELVATYARIRDAGDLTVRVAVSWHVDTIASSLDAIDKRIAEIAANPLRKDDPMLRIIGVKAFLDGGMLTGSAYMLEPWGVSKIYAITDPNYRGVLFIPPKRLLHLVKFTAQSGLQFTAHAVGDGAVRNLLDAYEQAGKELSPGVLQATRPCISHSNFIAPDDIPRFHQLRVLADIQPCWLYHDGHTLLTHFGDERLKRFQPLRDLFEAGATLGGGSDHMQKIGARRAINTYDPFLGMATAVTRLGRDLDQPLHPEQALSRRQMIQMYTINNAYLLFKEHQVGSLEIGKFADFIVVDTDLLTCPDSKIADTRTLCTYLAGREVFRRP